MKKIFRRIKHQQQLTQKSCVHACISMLLDIDQGEVISDALAMFGKEDGLGIFETCQLLDKYSAMWNLFSLPTLAAPGYYIITVPSLNNDAGHHAVIFFMDEEFIGPTIFDPQEGTGNKFYTQDNLGGWSEPIYVNLV